MKNKNLNLLLVCFLLSCLFLKSAYAQNEPVDSLAAETAPKGSWVALPVIWYTPETSFGFGALGMRLFSLDPGDTSVRTSNVQMYALYTLNKQLLISPSYTLFFKGEKYSLRGNIAYFKFPRFYYGIGNQLPEENEELVDYTLFRLENRLLRKLNKQIFAGLQWNYYQVFNVGQAEGGLLETNKPLGWNGYRVSGLGAAVVLDTRDIVVNPSRGAYLEAGTLFNGKIFGSQHQFSELTIDARKYIQLHPNRHILALQGYGRFTQGAVPFLQLSNLGGAELMRGYYEGRYRDKQFIGGQAEYRMPIWWRFGAAAFAGLADVAPEIDEFRLSSFKPSYGLGLRFMVNPKEKVNIRLDYAWGQQTSGFYLEITEAF